LIDGAKVLSKKKVKTDLVFLFFYSADDRQDHYYAASSPLYASGPAEPIQPTYNANAKYLIKPQKL
jgi:hypothetical protein